MDGRTINLNSQQEDGLNTLDRWYISGDLFIRILGYAGTGKTTISKYFLDNVKDSAIVVSAPTHQAKRVVSTTTGYEGKTIQALLGLGLDVDLENFDPNKPEFRPKRDPEIANYKVVLIDEASMLSNKKYDEDSGLRGLLDMILDLAEQSGTRLIFLLDTAQLPPVNEKLIPTAITERITWEVKLTHVERQAGDNPLMPIYDKVRNNLKSYMNFFPDNSQINDKGEGITITKDNGVFARQIIESFRKPHEPGSIKVLCWRNVSVKGWNGFIRKYLFGPDAPVLKEGEILKSYSNVKGKIENSGEYLVEKIDEIRVNYDQTYDTYGKTLNIKTGEIRVYQIQVLDLYQKFRVVLDIVHQDDASKVAIEALRFMGAAKINRGLWTKYFDWRAKFYLMEDVFIKEKKALKKDLDYGYVITVHKSQGSTYDEVHVDGRDISINKDIEERNRLYYVAMSRPRKVANVLL